MRKGRWAVLAAAAAVGLLGGICSGGRPAAGYRLTRYDLRVRSVPTTEKVIAFTFDDGPHPQFTLQILDALDRYHARATFFVSGRQAERFPDVLAAVVRRGHEIGNHGYHHRDLRGNPRRLAEELDRTAHLIEAAGGPHPTLFRAPFGFVDDTLLQTATALGYRVIQWTPGCDAGDGFHVSTAEMVRRISRCGPGSIALMHDFGGDRSTTVAAVEQLLAHFTGQGFRVVAVGDLLRLVPERR